MEILQGLEKIVFLWGNAARNSTWLIFVRWNLNKTFFNCGIISRKRVGERMSKNDMAEDNKKSSRSSKLKQRDAIRREVSFLTFDGKRLENRAVDRKSVRSIEKA